MVKYTPAGEIVNVTLSLVMGFLHETALPLQQEFQIAFVQVRERAAPSVQNELWVVFTQNHSCFYKTG